MPPRFCYENQSDQQLVKEDTQSAFEELVRRYQVPLRHFLRKLVGGNDADDVLQQTFCQAYQRRSEFNPTYQFSTWLYTIGRRLALNHLRNEKYRRTESLPPDACYTVKPAENSSPLWERVRELLSEPEFTAIWMMYVEEMTLEEIAKLLGKRYGATKMLVSRARKKITKKSLL